MTAVELQLEGDGEGWIAGGVVNEDTSMVTSPAHQVLLFDYAAGAAQALALQGYEASDLKEVSMSALGITPLLLQSAAGKLYMRYDQSLASAPVDLTGTTNFMWAWAEFGYPAIHDRRGTVKINWTAGTCKPSMERFLLEGYWLLLLPFLGLILTWTGLKRTSWGHSLLQRRLGPIPTQLSVWVRTLTGGALPTFLNLKYGEVWMMATYGILQIAFMVYWTMEEGAVGVRTTGIAFGKAALTNLMMTFLPVNKTTLWVRLFGISFERSVKFHRQLSYLAMATMTIHLICMTLQGPVWDRTPLASGVVVAYGLLAFLSFTFMSLTAMLRRWCYELFRYTHYLYIAGTAFVLLHAPEAWQYLVVPCVLHVADFLWRWYNIFHNPTWATLAALPGDVTQVDVRNRQKKRSRSNGGAGGTGGGNGKWASPLEPGSYVWVCIPQLSLLQWHPISISTAGLLHEGGQLGAEAPLFHLHIKSLGEGTWTNGLYQIAAQEVENSQSHGSMVKDENAPSAPPMSPPTLAVLVDGPYGKLSIDLQRYRQLVLVAGGIGLTPMTSVLSYISHCTRKGIMPRLKTVTLVWVLRDVALLDGFTAFLDQIRGELNAHVMEQQQPQQSSQQQCVHFGVQIYVTAVGGDTVDGANGIGLEDGSKAMHKQMGGGMRLVDGGGGGQKHFRILYGRPKLSEIFDTLVNDTGEGQSAASTGVLACAPEGLLHQVQRQCVLRTLDVHIEEFSY
jgi:predicted ferric reductase